MTMTSNNDEDTTTETDFRILDVTRTATKETVVDVDIPAVMIVREPEPEQIVEMKPTVVDVDLRALVAEAKPTVVDVDLRAVVLPVTVPADARAETEVGDDDATLVDSVRPLPVQTPTGSVTQGSAPAVRRFNVEEK